MAERMTNPPPRRHRPARSPAWWSTCKAVRSPGPRSGAFPPGEVRAHAHAAPTGGSACPRSSPTSRSPSGPTCRAWRERRDDVRIFPGKDRDIGRLTLLPGTRIAAASSMRRANRSPGRASSSTSTAIVLGHTISSQGTEWTFSADGDGRFATPPLPAGDGHFSLSAPGKVRTFVGKKAEPGTSVVDLGDITLPDEMPVAGIVTDAEGKPAPGVEVIADYDWENSAKTDKDGRFTVHGVGKDLKSLQPPVERLLRPQAVRRRPRPD